MITSYKQLLEETLAKYEQATALNRIEGNDSRIPGKPVCFYAAIKDGAVGCAIGCHLDLGDAEGLDEYNDGPTGIQFVARRFPDIINATFDVGAIGLGNMQTLQRTHDGAANLDNFRNQLRTAIAALA